MLASTVSAMALWFVAGFLFAWTLVAGVAGKRLILPPLFIALGFLMLGIAIGVVPQIRW